MLQASEGGRVWRCIWLHRSGKPHQLAKPAFRLQCHAEHHQTWLYARSTSNCHLVLLQIMVWNTTNGVRLPPDSGDGAELQALVDRLVTLDLGELARSCTRMRLWICPALAKALPQVKAELHVTL